MSDDKRALPIHFLLATLLILGVVPLSAQELSPPEYNGVLLDFTAPWCSWCQKVAPIVHQMERQGLPVRSVDTDQNRELATRFKITGLPCFVLIVDGKEVQRASGYQSEQALREMVSRIPIKNPPRTNDNLDRPSAPPPHQSGSSDNRTHPPQFPGHPSQPEEYVPPRLDKDEKKLVENQRGFSFPFRGKSKTKSLPDSDKDLQARAKIDDLKLPKLDRPSPIASSTRVCVTNRKNGSNLGSGTIISSEIGQTYILTCGHVFRDFDPQTSLIEVDFFVNIDEKPVTFVGKLVKSDLKADVGLIAIPTDTPLPVTPVVGPDFQLKPRDSVLSIGCGGGEVPSEQHLAVTRINRYSGPHNIECTGLPEQGRSGGGLFSPDGKVIGVCTAADKQDQRGIYAGFQAIHRLLDQTNLSRLYRAEEINEPLYVENGGRSPRSSPDREVASIDPLENKKLSEHLTTLRKSLGDLGGEEVLVRLTQNERGDRRKMLILRDTAPTSPSEENVPDRANLGE